MTTTTNPATQRRLTALLVGAIYAIVDALFPIIDTIAHDTARPWNQRASLADRLTRILQELLALTARIPPNTLAHTLSHNPTNPPTPATTTPAATTPATPTQPGPLRPLRPLAPARLLSPRQFAKRLEALLRQLENLAAEIGAALPDIILRCIERARAITACDTPPPQTTWERTG